MALFFVLTTPAFATNNIRYKITNTTNNGGPLMKVMRICAHCGAKYITHLNTSEYCSSSCRGKAYRERKKKELAKNANED